MADRRKYLRQHGQQDTCKNRDQSNARSVPSLDPLNSDQENPQPDMTTSELTPKYFFQSSPSFPTSRPPHRRHGQVTKPLGPQRYYSSHYPFLKRRRIIPPYRTGHRHHSLEWLTHLNTVYCLTRQ